MILYACSARRGDVFHSVSTRLSAERLDRLVAVCDRRVSTLWSRHSTTITLPHRAKPRRRQRLSAARRRRGIGLSLCRPPENSSAFGCRLFRIAPTIWNSLRSSIRPSQSMDLFLKQTRMKIHFFAFNNP